jgi:hypothetical protein
MADDDPRNVVISRGADLGIITGIGLTFLASSIYGYEVTTSCHDLKRGIIKEPASSGAFPAPLDEDEKRRARRREPDPFASFAASPEARPVDLPKTVGSFAFAMTPAEAEKICAATGRVWEQQGVNANCRPKTEGSGDEMARLEFDLGSLTKIAIVHAPDESSFNKTYEALHTKLKIRYGTPQVRRAPLSGDCATALPECMKRGETFKGSTWGLPSGRVELVPVWRDQRALLDERYAREQAPAE